MTDSLSLSGSRRLGLADTGSLRLAVPGPQVLSLRLVVLVLQCTCDSFILEIYYVPVAGPLVLVRINLNFKLNRRVHFKFG